jgi:glutamate racemase
MAKIGVLDSGVGGLSVLPGVPTLYYADQGHVPTGRARLRKFAALALSRTSRAF